MKQNLILYGSLLLLLCGACQSKPAHEASVQTVKLDTVRKAGELSVLQFPGKVKAAQDVNLAFRVSGTISRILVSEGQAVGEGQVLAELDPTDYQVQLDATEAEYKQVKAEAERVMALYQGEATSKSNYDKAVYGLQQITAKYQHHKDQLAYTRLKAPFAGRVQKHLFDAHETVAAGMPVVSLVGNGRPEVEISLPAAEYVRHEQFEDYGCTFDLYPGHTYRLRLLSMAPKANANQLYTMRLQLMEADGPMPSPGLNTMVSIRLRETADVRMSVPTGALWRKDARTYVYVYDPSTSTVDAREVEVLSLLNNGRSLVRSAQLRPGEPVVASGARFLRPGEQVTPLPAPTETNVGGLL